MFVIPPTVAADALARGAVEAVDSLLNLARFAWQGAPVASEFEFEFELQLSRNPRWWLALFLESLDTTARGSVAPLAG